MSVQEFKSLNHGVKEGQESILFTLFTNKMWFEGFNAHPLHYFFMPILGLTFLINAALDWYQYKRAMNKNLELLLLSIASTLSAIGAITAIAGTLTGHALGFSFVFGPYFFIGALSIGLLTQSTLFFLNGYRAFMAPKNSEYRSHHLQAMVNNLLTIVTLAAIVASVVVVMIVPGGPTVITAIAAMAVALTLANLTWRCLPQDTKDWFKKGLGLAKPNESITIAQTPGLQISKSIQPQATSSLFVQGYRKHHVRVLLETAGRESALDYLQKSIAGKQAKLGDANTSKASSKQTVLDILSASLQGVKQLPAKKDLNQQFPHAFQSLLRYKGDVEDLYDAVEFMGQYLEPRPSPSLS